MPQYTNSIIEVSALGDFETEVNKLLAESRASIATGDNNASEFVALLPQKPTSSMYSSILLDTGNGRISQGLRGLELLSILCSGTAPNNLFLFDSVIYTGSAYQFKNGTDAQLIALVTSNLGMTAVVNGLPTSQTSAYITKCLSIAKEVKGGRFIAATSRKSMIASSKKLVKYYLGIV